jgi:hypothetical protein
MTQPTQPQTVQQAELHGRMSARAGRAMTACPYDPLGSAAQRVLARRWMRAYLDASEQPLPTA